MAPTNRALIFLLVGLYICSDNINRVVLPSVGGVMQLDAWNVIHDFCRHSTAAKARWILTTMRYTYQISR